MAGLPHDGTAAMLLNIVIQALGGLHFAQHRAAGTVLQNIAREDHHEAIAPENVPLLVNRADPVGVTVISDSDVRAGFLYRPDEILKVLDDGRVRMVVGEPTVEFAI